MAEQTQEVQEVQETSENIVTRFYGFGYKTFLAGIGALSLLQDELVKGWENGNEFANKLVERGEEVSKERREQMTERAEKRQEQVKEMRQGFGDRIGETYVHASETVLNAANVPTRSDIQDLSKQIDSLSRKVDRVRKEQKEAAAATA